MGDEYKFVTQDGGLRRKNAKKVLSSAKRAHNEHKKNWRAQAKLSDVLSNDIMRMAKKRS